MAKECQGHTVQTLGTMLVATFNLISTFRFASQLGYNNFEATNGFLHRFNERKGLVSKKASGERASVNIEQTEQYSQTVLKALLERYNADDIYNVDKTGLFYKLLPDRTYAFKGEECHGGKLSKDRITLLLGSNMSGTDKIKPVVMGKSAKPRCFAKINTETLPVIYRSNRTAWMTCEIFNEWLFGWDRRMMREGRKVLLLIDNCAAHNLNRNYSNIEVQFLPPNTTSVLQPMDQGIIKSFKTHYKSHLLHRLLAEIDRDQQTSFKVNLLDAIHIVSMAWREVTCTTIANCFKKAGFIKSEEPENVPAVEDEEQVDRNIWDLIQHQFNIDVPSENYLLVDDAVLTSASMTDEEIIQAVKESKEQKCNIKCEEKNEEDEEEKDQSFVPENTAQCLEAISGIHTFFQSSSVPEHVFNAIKILEDHALKTAVTRTKKQCKITDMFKKE